MLIISNWIIPLIFIITINEASRVSSVNSKQSILLYFGSLNTQPFIFLNVQSLLDRLRKCSLIEGFNDIQRIFLVFGNDNHRIIPLKWNIQFAICECMHASLASFANFLIINQPLLFSNKVIIRMEQRRSDTFLVISISTRQQKNLELIRHFKTEEIIGKSNLRTCFNDNKIGKHKQGFLFWNLLIFSPNPLGSNVDQVFTSLLNYVLKDPSKHGGFGTMNSRGFRFLFLLSTEIIPDIATEIKVHVSGLFISHEFGFNPEGDNIKHLKNSIFSILDTLFSGNSPIGRLFESSSNIYSQ